MPTGRVLVVDDEQQVLRALTGALTAVGYTTASAASGAAALELAALRPPDAVVLDLRLPDLDGVEVCRRLRAWSEVPVVVVSAVDTEAEKIAALDAGADDYVTKPYAVGELLARLRATMRRSAVPETASPVVRFGDVELDLSRRMVTRAGAEVHLTPHEFALLAELARHPGRVLTHRSLLNAVWGPGYGDETHYLRVYMGRLRGKVETTPARPRHLRTETGVGYRLVI